MDARRRAQFMKHDALTRAVSEALLIADPVGLNTKKIPCRDIDTYSYEATTIVKKIRTSVTPSCHQFSKICYQLFVDWYNESMANQCKQWSQIGEVIFWLLVNEGKWENG